MNGSPRHVQCLPQDFPRFSAEIVTTIGSYFVSMDSVDERDAWIESIRKASVSANEMDF